TVVIPAAQEAANLALLLPQLRETLASLGIEHEVLIVTPDRDLVAAQETAGGSARVLQQEQRGYGGALLTGFSAARGQYILTMDADLSHPPMFIREIW